MAVAAAGAVGAWLNLVGPASDAVTKIVSLTSQLPAVSDLWKGSDPSGISGVSVNIGIGSFSGGEQDNLGGDGLKVSGFDSQGDYVGTKQFSYMSPGNTQGLSLGKANAQEAWQLTITAGGSDAVCVQYVELTWMGTITSGFDGTWGRDCNQDWYYSMSTWGNIGSIPYRPDCFWFGGSKHKLREMWVDMEAMIAGAPVDGSNSSTQTYCNSKVMKFSSAKGSSDKATNIPDGLGQDSQGNGPPPGDAAPSSIIPGDAAPSSIIPSNAAPSSIPPQRKREEVHHSHLPPGKRNVARASTPTKVTNASPVSNLTEIATETGSYISTNAIPSGLEQVLVVSDIEAHSAEDLCTSGSSFGPDFVSQYEKKFCDMATKTTHPLCGGSVQTDCFDIDQAGKKLRKRGWKGSGVSKAYQNVHSWSANDAGSSKSTNTPSASSTSKVSPT